MYFSCLRYGRIDEFFDKKIFNKLKKYTLKYN